ncbi:MAG: Putative N-acetylgalactosaminyl-diphosphoundecaprenol glucuronosyltransferase [Burkholderiaceae bacterium]|jgi:teichuronic acid biosynthesis glycosyltransferase TuaG|nr:MAG: Putative N-acetylgalactosaminyl-diphosphoundecaprenol glucuronosyltransferase [Burkholderiaceae bacterium]
MTVGDDDLVSIITPAYRAAGVVGETIRSVVAQTHPHWEMLIADDCSPDDTREVVRQWEQADPRVKLIALARNGGPAQARNAALERARGRWIAFLDSDDLWLPAKLERSIAHARQQQAGFVFTGFRRINADGSVTGRYIAAPRSLSYRQLLGNTAIATSTVLLDRRVVGEIRMRKTYYDDLDCWLRILKGAEGAQCGRLAHGLDDDLMRYRVMGHSVSRNKRRSAAHVWRAYRELERLSLPASLWYFGQYALHGVLKYRKF